MNTFSEFSKPITYHIPFPVFNVKHWLRLSNSRLKTVLVEILCCLQGVTEARGVKSRGPGDALQNGCERKGVGRRRPNEIFKI